MKDKLTLSTSEVKYVEEHELGRVLLFNILEGWINTG